MLRANWPANGLRFGLFLLTATVALTAIATDPADARGRRRHFHGPAYSPPYAALVIDANSGQVLHNTNADAQRHPASLTKIMTLYLLFEQIESGKLRLDSQMEVSDHASQQAPSKLGLQPGQTISVEDGIRALVTKSANDVAVVIAEAIGGDEESFARMMTRKARALGMSRTIYMNASGLPDDDQLTTARDQVTLGRAIQDRFPRYYRYFQTASFVFRGRAIRNHNKLLGRVEGVDGIKTGYTRASGFNLVSSVRRGNRHLVACVLGGASGGARDARMRALLEQHIASAATARTVAKITEGGDVTASATIAAKPAAPVEPRIVRDDTPITVASVPAEKPDAARAAAPAPAETTASQPSPTLSRAPQPGSGDPINPVKVKTITVKPGAIQTASLGPLVMSAPQATIAPPHFAKSTAAAPVAAPLAPPPGARPGVLGVLPVETATAATPPAPDAAPGYRMASASAVPITVRVDTASVYAARGPWLIQIGAFPKESEAMERLSEAQSVGKTVLGKSKPFTEKFIKGAQEYHRARFDGFNQSSAEAACSYFKRKDIPCMAIRM
jgi:D-alanyl-D-alanine carboxypeptidase